MNLFTAIVLQFQCVVVNVIVICATVHVSRIVVVTVFQPPEFLTSRYFCIRNVQVQNVSLVTFRVCSLI